MHVGLMGIFQSSSKIVRLPHLMRFSVLGLHFNITEGKPVSDKTDVSSLLKPDGMFWPKTEFRNRLLDQRSIILEQVCVCGCLPIM